jgi:deoxyribodipyrimidine photolyase-related protein
VVVLPDQLTDEVGPLADVPPRKAGILMVESGEWLRRRPYHRQRIATILLNQRSFAIEQANRGVAVRYLATEVAIGDAVSAFLRSERGRSSQARSLTGVAPATEVASPMGIGEPLLMMEPAEWEMRAEMAPLVAKGLLTLVPNRMFLTTDEDFDAAGRPPFRLEAFYRRVRERTGILMENGLPVGGSYILNEGISQSWNQEPEAPRPLRFRRTSLRDEVEAEILTRFSRHPGTLDIGAIPATRSEVRRQWMWAIDACLPHAGRYDSAMSSLSRGLFHVRLSPLLNIGRILPKTLVAVSLRSNLPLSSREAFVRHVLGWREFVRHVHRSTDGFRRGLADSAPIASSPGDGGYGRMRGQAWTTALMVSAAPAGLNGGACPNALEATEPLPLAYWGKRSGLACLDRVVADVWAEGWSHQVTRQTVLANIATLLGVHPRELTDWFWAAYVDAYDWVVEPNVLGLSTWATGDLMAEAPAVADATRIAAISDYCGECAFDPASDCPIAALHRQFASGKEVSARNAYPAAQRASDRQVVVHVRDVLVRGERLSPQGLRSALLTRNLVVSEDANAACSARPLPAADSLST